MISTGQLDGERALKPKYATKETQNNLSNLVSAEKDDVFSVHCSAPDPDLFFFDGVQEIRNDNGEKKRV